MEHKQVVIMVMVKVMAKDDHDEIVMVMMTKDIGDVCRHLGSFACGNFLFQLHLGPCFQMQMRC